MADKISLKVYIAGKTPAAGRAIQNLHEMCADLFDDRDYDIAIIDILENPAQAEKAKILATPTVVRAAPSPERRVIGDLSDRDEVLNALGLAWN